MARPCAGCIPRSRDGRLGINLTPTQCTKFADQEIGVRIQESVRDEDVFIIQSPAPPSVSPSRRSVEGLSGRTGSETRPTSLAAAPAQIACSLKNLADLVLFCLTGERPPYGAPHPHLGLQDGFGSTNNGCHPVLPLRSAGQEGQVSSTHHRKVSALRRRCYGSHH